MSILGAISIPINPHILDFGPFLLSWHGLLTFVAVAIAVVLTVRWGRRAGLDGDAILSVAVWCIVGGIIGARLLHVIDFWSLYSPNPIQILMVWTGGLPFSGRFWAALSAGRLTS